MLDDDARTNAPSEVQGDGDQHYDNAGDEIGRGEVHGGEGEKQAGGDRVDMEGICDDR